MSDDDSKFILDEVNRMVHIIVETTRLYNTVCYHFRSPTPTANSFAYPINVLDITGVWQRKNIYTQM